MCTDAFHIRRIEGLRKILSAAQTYAIDTTKDTEGCPDVREVMIDNVKFISNWAIKEMQANVSVIEDEAEAALMSGEILEQLIDAVTEAVDHMSEVRSPDDIPRSDPSMN